MKELTSDELNARGMRICRACQRPINIHELNARAHKMITEINAHANSSYGGSDRFFVSGVLREIAAAVPVTPHQMMQLDEIWMRVVSLNPFATKEK